MSNKNKNAWWKADKAIVKDGTPKNKLISTKQSSTDGRYEGIVCCVGEILVRKWASDCLKSFK